MTKYGTRGYYGSAILYNPTSTKIGIKVCKVCVKCLTEHTCVFTKQPSPEKYTTITHIQASKYLPLTSKYIGLDSTDLFINLSFNLQYRTNFFKKVIQIFLGIIFHEPCRILVMRICK